ncbi:MAG: response regulator [Spirochaetes bacterium]|nr:response regulator [Spirochaetota bacterium]
MHAIIVDDNESDLLLLHEIVTHAGFIVTSFSEPFAALAFYKQSPADVVVSDLQMPLLQGDMLMEQILRVHHDAVFIMHTGYDDERMMEKIMSSGAYAAISKDLSKEMKIDFFSNLMQYLITRRI